MAEADGFDELGLPAFGCNVDCGLVCREVGLGVWIVPGGALCSPFSLGLFFGEATGSGWVAWEFLLE